VLKKSSLNFLGKKSDEVHIEALPNDV